MTQITDWEGKVLVDRNWNTYQVAPEGIVSTKTHSKREENIGDLELGSVKYFNTPFRSMIAIKENQVVSEWWMTPFTFHLGSPFDYADEVKKFANGETIYPLDLNVTLTDRCNYSCTFCMPRKEREAKKPKDLKFSTYTQALDFFRSMQPKLVQSLSCGGSGEAVIHPQFNDILRYSGKREIGTYITTNGSRTDEEFVELMAKHASVVVFSIHGITENAFQNIQRPLGGHRLEDVINTISRIRQKSIKTGREDKLSLRVLTTVHAQNAGNYAAFIKRLIDVGINQISFNPILPYPAFYDILIDEKTKKRIIEEFEVISEQFEKYGVPIKLPDKPFQDNGYKFFDPSVRKNKETCLISLLQPKIGPIYGDPENAKFSACRFYPVVTGNPDFWYTSSLGEVKAEEVWTRENLEKIQNKTSDCRECANERQIMALDWMLSTIKAHKQVDFMLNYGSETDDCRFIVKYSQSLGKNKDDKKKFGNEY